MMKVLGHEVLYEIALPQILVSGLINAPRPHKACLTYLVSGCMRKMRTLSVITSGKTSTVT